MRNTKKEAYYTICLRVPMNFVKLNLGFPRRSFKCLGLNSGDHHVNCPKMDKNSFSKPRYFFFFSLSEMNSNGDTVYAVIIVCVVVFLSLISCFCLRYWRRARRNNNAEQQQQQPLSQLQQQQQQPLAHEWQQLRSVIVLHSSTEVGEDIQPVLSNVTDHDMRCICI